MFRGFSSVSEKIIAIVDIRSDSVGACIGQFTPRVPATILAAERLSLPLENRAPERAKTGVLSLLRDVCQNTLAAYMRAQGHARMRHVEKSYIVLGTPWVSSETVRASVRFDKEERISDETISDLARQAFRTKKGRDRSQIFEAGVTIVELNGYPTEEPVGKHAHGAFVSALLSMCESGFRSRASEIVQNTFPSFEPILRSEARALMTVSRKGVDRPRDCTIMSVDGDATSCVVIRKGAMAEHVIIPEGTRTLLKRISAGLPEETLTVLRMMTRDACTSETCEKLETSLSLIEPDLVKTFGQVLAELGARHRLPNPLTLVVRPEFAPWFARFFSRIDFAQFTITTQPFVPNILTIDEMSQFMYPAPGIVLDTGLSLAASLVNIEDFHA